MYMFGDRLKTTVDLYRYVIMYIGKKKLDDDHCLGLKELCYGDFQFFFAENCLKYIFVVHEMLICL